VAIKETEDHQKIVQGPIKEADHYGRQALEKARDVSVLDKFAIESAINYLEVLNGKLLEQKFEALKKQKDIKAQEQKRTRRRMGN